MRAPEIRPENRSLAFWAWNDRLEQKELFAQMRQLKHEGYGGFFMHSREGLETEYMSDEWLRLCQECARAAYEKQMLPFLYDEDKWPSGMAGGMVSKQNPSYAAQALVYVQETDRVEVMRSLGHPWYSGNAPANNLSQESVRCFLELTHEKYAAYFGGSLHGKVEGFFTDEPNFWDFFFTIDPVRPALPYTDDLEQEFCMRRGYALNPRLLFFREEGYQRHRHDYWRTLSELFCERYTRQLFEWCEEQQIKLCGHMLFENELGYQTRVCGAVMPHYQYMHIPGIDILGEQTREYLTVKQCTSVAHQYAKEAAISETYGCTGWDFTFEGQKRLWDFQCALGITIRSEHLSFYSIRGLRKRDYPPAFSYQNEGFQYQNVIEEYCARLSAVMSEGTPQRDVLVVHPISGIWCESGSMPTEDLREFDDNMGWTCEHIMELNAQGEELNLFAESLLKNGIDFDFGDEQLMAKDGTVAAEKLRIAQATYSVVILPSTQSIFGTTLQLLREFVDAGGVLIVVGPLPVMIEGRPADVSIHGAQYVDDYAQAIARAKQYVCLPAQIEDVHTAKTADVITVFRTCEDGVMMVAVNEDVFRACKVKLNRDYHVCELDLLTGKQTRIAVREDNSFYADFIKSDCKVYLLKEGRADRQKVARAYKHPHCSEDLIAALPPVAKFVRSMPNALTLDFCAYCFEGEAYSMPMQIWQAQREIRSRLGHKQIVGNGVDMRYTWIGQQQKTENIQLKFCFEVHELPETPLYFCVEQARRFQVTCNGRHCEHTDEWFLDQAIGKVRLEGVTKGSNTVELSCVYSHDMELEDCYVIGDFGVSRDRVIIREPDVLHMGDITLQGYLHYPGSMTYQFCVDSATAATGILDVGEYQATLLALRVNGRDAGYIINGSQAEIGLEEGENRIEIKAVGSNRNLLGPFHHTYDGCSRIGWKDFRMEEGERYTPEYIVKAYGLLSQIKILGK